MGISKRDLEPSRAERKAKKRKLEEAIPDLPGDTDAVMNIDESPSKVEESLTKRKMVYEKIDAVEILKVDRGETKASKREKRAAKRQKNDGDRNLAPENKCNKEGETGIIQEIVSVQSAGYELGPRKSKKERKAERRARDGAGIVDASANKTGLPMSSNGDAPSNIEAEIIEDKNSKKNNRNRHKKRKGFGEVPNSGENADGKSARFIVFIGNLPFSATTESIRKHFAAVKPISIRHLTRKEKPTESKGCAFVEFEGYDHMKTCLKLFHHSMFDDGTSPPRKINVELTAGGGGNTKDRRAKIEGKNQKLNEERIRRIQEEVLGKNGPLVDQSAIHPSRRARIPGA